MTDQRCLTSVIARRSALTAGPSSSSSPLSLSSSSSTHYTAGHKPLQLLDLRLPANQLSIMNNRYLWIMCGILFPTVRCIKISKLDSLLLISLWINSFVTAIFDISIRNPMVKIIIDGIWTSFLKGKEYWLIINSGLLGLICQASQKFWMDGINSDVNTLLWYSIDIFHNVLRLKIASYG
jgi:hypothetical protein